MKEQFKTVNVGTFSELINLRQRFENFGVWTFLTEKTNKNNTLTVINCCLLLLFCRRMDVSKEQCNRRLVAVATFYFVVEGTHVPNI